MGGTVSAMRSARLPAIFAILCSGVVACGDDDAGPTLGQLDAADAPSPDGHTAADSNAVTDTAVVPADTHEPAPDWALPPCDRACDRLTDCGVDSCVGWDWTTAGELFVRCWSACDDSFEHSLLAADSCAAVETLAASRLAAYSDDCLDNPCILGCQRLGSCVVDACSGYDPPVDAQIADDCASDCNPDDVAWLLQMPTCQSIVDAIADNDANFAQQCFELTSTCPTAASCEAYADKVAGCMVEHCGDPIAPWVDGIDAAFVSFCAEGEDCPTQAAVDYVLSDSVTCDTEGLADAGQAPPFTAMCDGSVPVDQADAEAACAAFLACPGTEWLTSTDLCAVHLALRDDAAQVTACLGAAGNCQELYACVSEE